MAYIAPNTTSGKREMAEPTLQGSHSLKYEQNWDKSPEAINKTPYMKYQNGIMGRDAAKVKRSMGKLKQD